MGIGVIKRRAKRKPLECVTRGSIANASESLTTLPFRNAKRARGRPPKVAGGHLIPGASLAQFDLNLGPVSTSTSSINGEYNLEANRVRYKSEIREKGVRGFEQDTQLGRERVSGRQWGGGENSILGEVTERVASEGRRVDKDGVKVKEKNGDKEAGKMEPKKGERRLGEAGKGNGKEKEKIDKLPVQLVFDFL